jgi:hypothetical protein
MPFTTGTAVSPSDLLSQISTFVEANGWVKLRGETDLVPVSPKAARYWRILMTEQQINSFDFFQLEDVEFRETVGGANLATVAGNWSASSDDGTNVVGNLLPGGSFWQSQDIDDAGFAWVMYDFGAPQIIRECVMKCNNENEAPTRFHIQWSHDARTWCTMDEQLEGISWVDNQTRTYTFDDGYLLGRHVSTTQKRTNGTASQATGDGRREDDWWVWQGPGYDAARRVYVGAKSAFTLSTNSHYLEMRGFTEFTGTEFDLGNEEGADGNNTRKLIFDSGSVDYWLYVNSLRIIVVVKSGASDYTSMYMGFGAAFAQPDDWGFPLYIGGTADGFDAFGDIGNEQSVFCDPGNAAARVRLWDNTWQSVQNRAESSVDNLIFTGSDYTIHPFSFGSGVGDGNFPYCQMGDNDSGGSHFLDSLDPTEQDDLPIFACILQSRVYGNLMALSGVFAIPSGGLLSPEQVLNIGGQDYRVFPNRTRRDGNNFYLIRED